MRELKKYPNRRLYDTAESCFITLADVKRLVLDREDFIVHDSKTGQDLTRSVLMQIIAEAEEQGGETLLSHQVLQDLIRLYGSGMDGILSQYLEQSMAAFLEQQDSLQQQMKKLIENNPANLIRKITETESVAGDTS